MKEVNLTKDIMDFARERINEIHNRIFSGTERRTGGFVLMYVPDHNVGVAPVIITDAPDKDTLIEGVKMALDATYVEQHFYSDLPRGDN